MDPKIKTQRTTRHSNPTSTSTGNISRIPPFSFRGPRPLLVRLLPSLTPPPTRKSRKGPTPKRITKEKTWKSQMISVHIPRELSVIAIHSSSLLCSSNERLLKWTFMRFPCSFSPPDLQQTLHKTFPNCSAAQTNEGPH